jgi:hypothetical protein
MYGFRFWKMHNFGVVILCAVKNNNVVAAWNKKEFDFIRIQSHNYMCMSPVCYHRANLHCVKLMLIYNT